MRVTVYLNQHPGAIISGYASGDPLTMAYAYPIGGSPDEILLHRVFAAFNGHPEHDDDKPHTEAWYANRHRSLSVGDLVALDDRHYACHSMGWTPVPAPPH